VGRPQPSLRARASLDRDDETPRTKGTVWHQHDAASLRAPARQRPRCQPRWLTDDTRTELM
jgi:hypothetical protein